MGLYELTERLESIERLDGIAKQLATAVGKAVPHGPAKDVASGTWLGHALHPVLTDVPIGMWMGAVALDVLGGRRSEPAADLLVKLGLVAVVPTAVSGLSDWSDTLAGERRVGLVHAGGNGTASLFFASSLWARKRGSRGLGIALGMLGAGATVVSAYLGGHLSLSLGVGVDQTALEEGPEEWTTVMRAEDLGDGRPTKVEAGGVAVLVVRSGESVFALSDRCSHLSGPLHEGRLDGDCIVCPWHGSAFRLRDGSVAAGPARAPQPAYDVRVHDGGVQVKTRARAG